MQRYRHAPHLLLGLGLLVAVGGCSVPSRRENVDAAAGFIAGQVAAPLEWRLDSKSDAEARTRAEAMLADGLSLQEAIRVSFLVSPDLQLALERLEISRAEFVAAATAPNPVGVVGSRQPNGDLAAFYPDRTISIGVVQNVIALLAIPERRGIARRDLERARYQAASDAVQLAAEVAQAWVDYSAALQLQALAERAASIYQLSHDNLLAKGDEVAADTLEEERRGLLVRRGDAIRAQLDAIRAREHLGEKLGITGWRDDWGMQGALPALPVADPDPVLEEHAAMGRRLDLLAANQAVEARLRVLSHQRHFRWLNQLDIGMFREQVVGGTSFTGPNAGIELPLFDQRQSQLLTADSELRSELRRTEAARLAARGEIRIAAAELAAARQLVEQIEREIQPSQLQQQATPAGGDPDDTDRLVLKLDVVSTDESKVKTLRDYWRARSALALAAGNWSALSGLQ
jgi:outer membrane protein, heavy metal efflux system